MYRNDIFICQIKKTTTLFQLRVNDKANELFTCNVQDFKKKSYMEKLVSFA